MSSSVSLNLKHMITIGNDPILHNISSNTLNNNTLIPIPFDEVIKEVQNPIKLLPRKIWRTFNLHLCLTKIGFVNNVAHGCVLPRWFKNMLLTSLCWKKITIGISEMHWCRKKWEKSKFTYIFTVFYLHSSSYDQIYESIDKKVEQHKPTTWHELMC